MSDDFERLLTLHAKAVAALERSREQFSELFNRLLSLQDKTYVALRESREEVGRLRERESQLWDIVTTYAPNYVIEELDRERNKV